LHTLSALVSEALRANPYCGDVFVFRSKRMDRVKLLAWDGSGMVLVTKWLRQGRFTLPRQRLRSIPQTTFARKPQTKSQNLANSDIAKAQSTLQFRAFLVLHGRLIQLRHLP
jgi:transposase